jgi:hypothetical protein
LFLLFLVPFLFLFHTYLAIAALIAAIAFMSLQRTRPPKRGNRAGAAEPVYKAGYED